MIKTEYICDKCKAVQPTKELFWAVRVSVRTVDHTPGWGDTNKEQQWCRACVVFLIWSRNMFDGFGMP